MGMGPTGPGGPGNTGPTGAAAAATGDFIFVSRNRFPTDFALEPRAGYEPSAAERVYIQRLDDCIAAVSDLRPQNTAPPDPNLQQQKETDARDPAVRVLRTRAEAVCRAQRGAARDAQAAAETIQTYRIEGRYREWMLRIDTTPFTVKLSPDGGPLFNDLQFTTRDVRIPDEKARLKVEIDGALTVTKVVFGERENAVPWWTYLIGQYAARQQAVRMRLNEYMIQLSGIAEVGLMNRDPTQVAFARQDLTRYKAEFAAREAGTVKNRHVRRLGGSCFVAIVVLLIGYAIARAYEPGTIIHDFRNFFLLGIGTAVGTWLSFSLRRQVLTFDDLAVLEEDRLDSSMRILFMIALVTVPGLLFWAQAVNVGVGNLNSSIALYQHGAWSLLIGMLAGIAERSLGTAVTRRATDFAAALGGERAVAVQANADAPPAAGR